MKKTLRSAGIVLALAAGLSVPAAPGFATSHRETQPAAGGGASVASVVHKDASCRFFGTC